MIYKLPSTQTMLHYARWFSRQNTKYSSILLSFNDFFSFLGKGTHYRQTYLHQSWTSQAQYLQNRFPHSCQEQRTVEKGRQRGWRRSPSLQKNCQATFGSPLCHYWRKRATNFGILETDCEKSKSKIKLTVPVLKTQKEERVIGILYKLTITRTRQKKLQ